MWPRRTEELACGATLATLAAVAAEAVEAAEAAEAVEKVSALEACNDSGADGGVIVDRLPTIELVAGKLLSTSAGKLVGALAACDGVENFRLRADDGAGVASRAGGVAEAAGDCKKRSRGAAEASGPPAPPAPAATGAGAGADANASRRLKTRAFSACATTSAVRTDMGAAADGQLADACRS